MLPVGETITINGQTMPLSVYKEQEKEAKKRQLAFGDTRGVLGTGGISFQQQLLAAGVGGAANLAISQGQSYYRNTVYGEATGSMARSHAAAQALGRATWYKEQNRSYTMKTATNGHNIVNHYVKNAMTAEDKQAMTDLGNSHEEQRRIYAEEAFDEGRNINLLWLRKQTEAAAKALSASIDNRIRHEEQTAQQFGTQIGITRSEALAILRDKSQGEQALADMLAFQLRLEAQSTGVVT